MQTARIASASRVVLKKFIDKLSAVAVVREILVSGKGSGVTLWVIIDAQPHDESPRLLVAEADGEATRETIGQDHPEVWVLNPAEYPGADISQFVPAGAKRLWQRRNGQ